MYAHTQAQRQMERDLPSTVHSSDVYNRLNWGHRQKPRPQFGSSYMDGCDPSTLAIIVAFYSLLLIGNKSKVDLGNKLRYWMYPESHFNDS